MANIKADGTQESMEMVRIGIDEIEGHKSYASRDNEDLTRTGKKPVLKVGDNSPDILAPPIFVNLRIQKRNFGFMSTLGFSCLVLSTWQGTFVYVLRLFLLLIERC